MVVTLERRVKSVRDCDMSRRWTMWCGNMRAGLQRAGHVILSLFVHSFPSFLVFPLVLVCSISPTACLRTGCPYHAASPPARLADPLCSPSTSSRPMASPACSRCTSSLRRDDYIQHGSDLDLGSFRCAFCTYKVRHDFPLQHVCALLSVSTNLSPLPHSFTHLSLPYFSSISLSLASLSLFSLASFVSPASSSWM